MNKIFPLLFLIIFLPILVQSHGLGNEIRKDVEGYFFDFDRDNPEPKVNEKITMSFFIFNSTSGLPIETDNFWLRISKGDKIFFTTNDLRFKKSGPVFISFLFSEAGDYTIDISTKYQSKEVSTNFTVVVSDAPEKYIMYGVLIILIILMIFLKFRRFRSRNKK